jgi:hypothetical protein
MAAQGASEADILTEIESVATGVRGVACDAHLNNPEKAAAENQKERGGTA